MKRILNGAEPLYYQVKESIKDDIQNGTYQSGDRIPAEPELSEQFQVSRITIRRAVEELCKEGFLEKRHGTGTFVRNHRITRKIENLMSFTDSCAASGMTSSSTIICRELISRDSPEFPKEESLAGTDRVLYIQRLRLADQEPVMLENNFFPADTYAFLQTEDLSSSLYRLLREKYQIQVTGSKNSYLDIVCADSEIATRMKVNVGSPLFRLHTEIYDSNGNLIHIGRQYINSERYRFYLNDTAR